MKSWIHVFLAYSMGIFICTGFVRGNSGALKLPVDQEKLTNNVADWRGVRSKCRPVPMNQVQVSGFLGKRIGRNLTSVLAGMKSPMPRGFEARVQGKEPPPEADRLAADSDLYKWLEGACYVYARSKNQEVKNTIDHIVDIILKCQKEDGYINTQVPPKNRFDDRINHDLYIAGHFFEAAVAHFRATGQENLLEAAGRWADYLISEYKTGNTYFEKVGEKEHPEYELGFLRLYRATGQQRYLDFSLKLAAMSTIGSKVSDISAGAGRLHAVRVGYFLAALADLYIETGDKRLYQYLPDLWEELTGSRIYVTGGLGYRERIPSEPFYLPHSLDDSKNSDIAETCASVAMMMFTWRMHSITADSRYFDLIETIFYNHYLGAMALTQLGNFYYNPLTVIGDQSGKTDALGPKTHRLMLPDIHRTACCLPNSWRFFGALPEYILSYDNDGLYVNLYTSSTVRHRLPDGRDIHLNIETDYPHKGKIVVRHRGSQITPFKLRLRIPAWCTNAAIKFSDNQTITTSGGQYFLIDRNWKPGEEITIDLSVPVRMIYSDSRITANSGQVVFARGPLIYCLENQDVDFPVELARVAISPNKIEKAITVEWRTNLLDGVNILKIPGIRAPAPAAGDNPYFVLPTVGKSTELILIPFYARANRGQDNRWVTFIPLSPKPESN
jgi:DUF1680 family protein